MGYFEEKRNDCKEENIVIREESAAKAEFLGTWLGEGQDTKMRTQRAMGSWRKLKKQLKHSRLTERTQARVVEATKESIML